MTQSAPDQLAQDAATAILHNDPVLGPICILLGLAVLGLAWAYKKSRDKIDDLNEKRIGEAQASTKAITDNTHTLDMLTATLQGNRSQG